MKAPKVRQGYQHQLSEGSVADRPIHHETAYDATHEATPEESKACGPRARTL